jgi:hypothetical protein
MLQLNTPLTPTPLPRGERGISDVSSLFGAIVDDKLCRLPLPSRERAGVRGHCSSVIAKGTLWNECRSNAI